MRHLQLPARLGQPVRLVPLGQLVLPVTPGTPETPGRHQLLLAPQGRLVQPAQRATPQRFLALLDLLGQLALLGRGQTRGHILGR